MHVYTLVELKSNRIGLLLVELRQLDSLIRSRAKRPYRMGLGYALYCVLRMLEIFSPGREPEVEGDDSLVVVAVEKREKVIYLKRWCKSSSNPLWCPKSFSASMFMHSLIRVKQ